VSYFPCDAFTASVAAVDILLSLREKEKGEGNGGTGSTPRRRKQTASPETGKVKRGRKVDKNTIQRADFAKPVHEQGETWEGIYQEYNRKYPRDCDASADTIRLAYYRQYPKPK